MPPLLKKITWTSKFDAADGVKLPDVKSSTNFYFPFDLPAQDIPACDAETGKPGEGTIAFTDVPTGYGIVAVLLKIDPTTLSQVKDPNFTLYLKVTDKDKNPVGASRQMSADEAKNGMVFVDALKDYPPPPDQGSHITIENPYPVKLSASITVVVGPPKSAPAPPGPPPAPPVVPPPPQAQQAQGHQGQGHQGQGHQGQGHQGQGHPAPQEHPAPRGH